MSLKDKLNLDKLPTVFNEIQTQDAVYITAPKPQDTGTRLGAEETAENLSLHPSQISAAYPVDVVDAGLKTLIVPVAALKDEVSVFPDEQVLKGFCLDNGIDIVLIYTLQTDDPQNIAHTRVFAPKFGYLEDPATGSGNSAFGHYMLKNGMWDGAPATVEQGGADRFFNMVHLSYQDGRMLFGGKATTRIKGTYYL